MRLRSSGWLLAPVLLGQALYVIARAQRLPEATGPRAGLIGTGPTLRLLIVGDSSAAGVGVETQQEALAGQLAQHLAAHVTLDWQLIAQSGITTAGALGLLDKADAAPFDVAIVALGVNDATRLRGAARFRADHQALARVLRAKFTVGRIIRSAVPPLGEFPFLPRPLRDEIGHRAAVLDQVLKDLSREEIGSAHLPFEQPLNSNMLAQDGFHPGAPLYRLWAAHLAERVMAETL